MPPDGWQKSLAGYVEVDGQNFEITISPSISGRATVLKDTNVTLPLELSKAYRWPGEGPDIGMGQGRKYQYR